MVLTESLCELVEKADQFVNIRAHKRIKRALQTNTDVHLQQVSRSQLDD